MRPCGPHGGWSRRAFLPLLALPQLPGQASYKGQTLPSDGRRFSDPATEFELTRLTSPLYETRMPSPPSRAGNRRSSEILCSSMRTGQWQVQAIELGSLQTRVLTFASALDPDSPAWGPGDKTVLYFDGGVLHSVEASGGKEREIYQVPDGWKNSGPIAVSDDGNNGFFIETSEAKSRLMRIRWPKVEISMVVERPGTIVEPDPNPRRALVSWRTSGGELWAAELDGSSMRRLETPPGRVLESQWSPEGRSVLYLFEPADPAELIQIREQEIDGRSDKPLGKTSQFVAFDANRNASVFLGASRSKASPNVLLLLRITRRELTLCEHRASQPASCAVQFLPNSQRLLFQSDRDGKWALYSMNLERFVEKTEAQGTSY